MSAQLSVRRVRVIDHHGDALRARVAADRLLSCARPGAPGLPPGAVLVVRRLRASLPDAGASAAGVAHWRSGVEAALTRAAAAASRPARELVPADAPAVRFDSRAELLATLARDYAAGAMSARWWWPAWLETEPAPAHGPVGAADPALLAGVLEAAAADVPAMFELLAARGTAAATARGLDPWRCQSIALRVAETYGVAVGRLRDLPPLNPAGTRPLDAPWREAVPEGSGPGLAAGQQLLLGLSLTLGRAPRLARSRSFAAALERWWEASVAGSAAAVSAPDATEAVGSAAPPTTLDSRSAPPSAQRRAKIASRTPRGAGRAAGEAVLADSGDSLLAAGPVDGPSPATASDAPPAVAPAALGPLDVASARTAEIDSPLAGLFYLLGLGIYLGLYGDFSSPREPGIALDPWEFVALVGRELLGPRARPKDPVWSVLAELSARAPGGHRLGAGFRAPRAWRVPRAWLAPFGDVATPWRWTVAADRLLVTHPAGFVVLDVPARGPDRLAAEMRRYGSPALLRAAVVSPGPVVAAGVSPSLARWVGWVAGYVRERLRVALGARTATPAVHRVLKRTGTIQLSPGRVDVTFPLADLPVELRLAGLDRSPGWIPAAGRFLGFHFD